MATLPIGIFRVAERSMEPSIHEGIYVLVCRWCRSFSPGDVVVLRSPEDGTVLVKRVKTRGKKGLFVIGDNAAVSRDSRAFGEVAEGRIIGKVVYIA